VFLHIAFPTLYCTWSDPTLSIPPETLLAVYEPFLTQTYHEMEQTFKKFVSDFEGLHRSSILGSSNKLFVDPDEKSVVAQFWSKLRKDKDADSSLLSKISEFALSKAKSLWLDAYSDSIFDPLLTFCAQLYSVPKSSFKQFTTSFPLDQLPKPPSRPAYQPPPLTSELRQRDNSAKSLVSDALAPLCISHMRFLQCSPCELQAVALEKTAIQLSTHIPILGFTIEEEDKVKLAKRVFLPAVQFDGDMNLFVGAVWKQFMKLPGASYFVARTALFLFRERGEGTSSLGIFSLRGPLPSSKSNGMSAKSMIIISQHGCKWN